MSVFPCFWDNRNSYNLYSVYPSIWLIRFLLFSSHVAFLLYLYLLPTEYIVTMLSPSYGRHAPPIRLSPSLEGLEKVIPPTSPLTISGRPYYLQLDKPLPQKPPQEDTPSMYTAAWSIDSSTIGSSSRCSSRESSRYSTDSYPIFVSSGSDKGTGTATGAGTRTGTAKIRDRRPSDGPGDGSVVDDRTLGSASIDAATKTKHASLDPLEVFLADHGHHHNDDEDRDVDDEKRHGQEVRHTVTDWTQNRYGPNHYFREKKWDFFPELATPGALPGGKFPSGRPASSTTPQTKTGKSSRTRNLSAFDFGRLNSSRGRGNTLDLAQNVRDSIKSVQRKLSNRPSLEKEKARHRQQPRPSTARSERYGYGALSQRTATTPSSQRTRTTTNSGSRNSNRNGSITKPPNYEDIFTASDRLKRTLSAMSTRSSIMPSPQSLPLPRRPKPLAIPLSPYQKYGAAIWEKCSQPRHRIASHNVRFPRYYQNRRRWSSSLFSTSSSSSSHCFSSTSSSTSTSSSNSGHVNRLRTQSNPVLPVSIPLRLQLQRSTREYVRVLQDGTSSMLGAIDGAKRRVIDARVDRRREQLKARIRLVGPVDPHTASYGRDETWV